MILYISVGVAETLKKKIDRANVILFHNIISYGYMPYNKYMEKYR